MLIKRNLWQEHKIRSSSANILRQCTSGREPAGIAAHCLDERYIFAVVNASIAGELGGYGCDESRRATKTGGVIGALEVVVDGFWHANNTNGTLYLGKVARQLVRGVHGIVAADVKYSVHLVFLELRFNLLVDGGGCRGF